MVRLHSSVLALALLACGCASQLNLAATPARTQQEAPVRAVLNASAAGTLVAIDDPTLLPAAVREAPSLKVVVAGRAVPVTKNPGGSLTFVLPAGTATNLDVNGNLRVVFVMNEIDSQVVTLGTGSPIQFAVPPVRTEPNNGFLVKGLKVKLHANTDAAADKYQFTWSFGASAQGPWQNVPGSGKDVEWEPPAPGNYFIKVDAVDRASQQAYSTTTTSAVVFVTDAKEVLTTQPEGGTVQRGNPVTLKFNRPAGLTGTDLSYAWSASASPQGPWTVVTGNSDSVSWLPTNVGSYYVKAEVSDRASGTVNTFVSPNAIVFVSEGRPIVTSNNAAVLRGDRVNLTFNVEGATGPFTWYYQAVGGSALGGTWTPINSGNGKTISHVVNEAGSYNFRVDFPDAGGAIKSFTTTEPVVNVREGNLPLISSDPPNAVIGAGGTVGLVLRANGVDETNYKFTWYAATNPSFGWTALPITNLNDAFKKTYTWKTQQVVQIGPSTVNQVQAAGSYFIRVDAADKLGTAVYTFTSSSPVVTIQP